MSDERIARIRHQARRRWTWRMTLVGLAGGIGGGVGPALFGGHRHQRAHHPNPVADIVGVVVLLTLSLGALWFVRSRARSDRGFYAAPLSAGLPRAQRRAVIRAVRRGRPGDDPVLRRVGTETARRLTAQFRTGLVVLAGFIGLELVEGLLVGHTTAGRALFLCGAALFALVLGLQLVWIRGARRYLTAVTGPGYDSPGQDSTG